MIVQRPPAKSPLRLDHEITQLPRAQSPQSLFPPTVAREPTVEILERLPVVANRVPRITPLRFKEIRERLPPFREHRRRNRYRLLGHGAQMVDSIIPLIESGRWRRSFPPHSSLSRHTVAVPLPDPIPSHGRLQQARTVSVP